MKIKISIIIPVYNAQNTIQKCIESLDYESKDAYEIILCEDNSRDNSWNLCCDLASRYNNITCIQTVKNSGPSHTRNLGLSLAKGEYIIFVDSDDYVEREYIGGLLYLAETFPDSLPICGYNCLNQIENTKKVFNWNNDTRKTIINHNDFFDLVDKSLLKQLWNKIFRKDLIDKYNIKFNESYSVGEDFQFVLDYIELCKIESCVITNKPLYNYLIIDRLSLMDNFGFSDTTSEVERLYQLNRIYKDTNNFEQRIKNLKDSYLYSITRNTFHNKKEKLIAIENIMNDGYALKHYYKYRWIMFKENIKSMIKKIF